MPEKTVNISATIPAELNTRLANHCEETRLKKSTVVAEALEKYFGEIDRKNGGKK